MDDKLLYAQQWNISSEYFYEQGYYNWMCNKISDKKVVLEVGCGTGHSTLSLLENGHKVIAIDKNESCIKEAKNLLIQNHYITTEEITDLNSSDVCFIKSDIVVDSFYKDVLPKLPFDVVICWNIGSYWNAKMFQFYLSYMLKYGLTPLQIQQNPESSYSELIIWYSCRIAQMKNVPIHIVDRGVEKLDEVSDPYYCTLKEEFDFSQITYNNLESNSISNGGRMLVTNGVMNKEVTVNIMLVSVLIK